MLFLLDRWPQPRFWRVATKVKCQSLLGAYVALNFWSDAKKITSCIWKPMGGGGAHVLYYQIAGNTNMAYGTGQRFLIRAAKRSDDDALTTDVTRMSLFWQEVDERYVTVGVVGVVNNVCIPFCANGVRSRQMWKVCCFMDIVHLELLSSSNRRFLL